MPRRIPNDRLPRLVEAATRVFLAQGYRRTQMSDVARAMGVAKGTLYLYVESKEALFDLVLRHADSGDGSSAPPRLPVPTPGRGKTLRYVRQRLETEAAVDSLRAALERNRAGNIRVELEEILRELYGILARNRLAIRLVDRCAADYPELARVWFRQGREGLLQTFERYLELRKTHLRPVPSRPTAARLAVETLVFWAVHRHFDPHPQHLDEETARETVIGLLVGALLAGSGR